MGKQTALLVFFPIPHYNSHDQTRKPDLVTKESFYEHT